MYAVVVVRYYWRSYKLEAEPNISLIVIDELKNPLLHKATLLVPVMLHVVKLD